MVCLSDDLQHDAEAVQAFTEICKESMLQRDVIKREIQFTDGCVSQHKSRVPFYHISKSAEEGFPIERTFFGSRHGKGPADGLGAVCKQFATRAGKARGLLIQNAALHGLLDKELTISTSDVTECTHRLRSFYLVQSVKRHEKYDDLKPLLGSHNIQCAAC